MNWLSSIRFRLMATTGLLAALLLSVTILGTVQFASIARTVDRVSSESELLIRLTNTLDNGDSLTKTLSRGWADPPDDGLQVRFLATLTDAQQHLQRAIARSPQGDVMKSLLEASKTFSDAQEKTTASRGKALDEIEALQLEEAITDALGTLAKLKISIGKGVDASLVGVRKDVRAPVKMFWTVAAVGLFVALLVMAFVLTRITTPINKLLAGVRALAQGERLLVNTDAKDELGELARSFNNMAEQITDRTARLRLVLDSTGDALIPIGMDGRLAGACSKRTNDWFGEIPEGVPVWEHLGAQCPGFAEKFSVAFDQMASEIFPFECAADLMPKDLKIGKTIYGLSYRAVGSVEKLAGVLVVISDVTAQREAEAQEAESKEVFSVVGLCFRDPELYTGFVEDSLRRLDLMKQGGIIRQQADLHTLKGNAGMIGFGRMAEACHKLEDEIAETGKALDPSRFEQLEEMFAESRKRVEALAGQSQDMVQVQPDEFEWLRQTLLHRDPATAARVSSWRLTRAERILEQLGGHAKRIGERMAKDVDVVVDCHDIRMDRKQFDGVWASMVHAIRNAVDHGIESPEERADRGKDRTGTVVLRGRAENGILRLSIEDDGRGIDVERLREKVTQIHGAAAASWSLIDLVCARGASTASEVTENSGRGVGVGALRDAVLVQGGAMRVETKPGSGTRFDIELPLANATWWQSASAA
ncbi:MAG: ATP-binding protein [Deltaproteobacteria bacterium]|nr:ATP-binding protein [Deltaproteobacteria bacterium]